jgi:ABC-type Fe3+/spermidine/putrescine transport system ATPase subunit
MLELEGLTKNFGDQRAVDAISLMVPEGEIVALLGPSGCGKTTTLRMIAGFERPSAGIVRLDGRDVTAQRPNRRGIGLVFQDYALFPHMTVAQNVDYGMRQHGVPHAERAERRAALMRLVRLEGLEARRPAQLSGGQQQRVALARALAVRPRLLLLDEPLSNLDARLREALRTELRDILRAAGTTALVVTHAQDEAMALSDRIVVMNRGRIEQAGTPEALYRAPATRFVAEFVGRSLWFAGETLAGAPPRFRTSEGIELVVSGDAGPPCGISIRPERVRLAARPDDVNRLPATVERVAFFGAELHYALRLAGGRAIELVLSAALPDPPQPGQVLTLAIDPADCLLTADGPQG